MKLTTKKLVIMALLAAISIVFVALVHFPIFPAAPFLEYDPADIPLFIGAFAFGPVAGIIMTAIVCLIQGLTVSAHSGVYGIIMHFIATGTFVLVAGNIYKRKKTRSGAAIALLLGIISWTVVMGFANLVITPAFMGAPVEFIKQLMFPVIIPFNIIKAGINSIITFIVYKSISNIINGKVTIHHHHKHNSKKFVPATDMGALSNDDTSKKAISTKSDEMNDYVNISDSSSDET